MINLSEKEYERLKKKDGGRHIRRTNRVQDDHEIHAKYLQALEILRDLKSTNGTMFLGQAPFRCQVQIIKGHTRTDQTNLQKGCEDALNKIAYYDDKQNKYISERPPWAWD